MNENSFSEHPDFGLFRTVRLRGGTSENRARGRQAFMKIGGRCADCFGGDRRILLRLSRPRDACSDRSGGRKRLSSRRACRKGRLDIHPLSSGCGCSAIPTRDDPSVCPKAADNGGRNGNILPETSAGRKCVGRPSRNEKPGIVRFSGLSGKYAEPRISSGRSAEGIAKPSGREKLLSGRFCRYEICRLFSFKKSVVGKSEADATEILPNPFSAGARCKFSCLPIRSPTSSPSCGFLRRSSVR